MLSAGCVIRNNICFPQETVSGLIRRLFFYCMNGVHDLYINIENYFTKYIDFVIYFTYNKIKEKNGKPKGENKMIKKLLEHKVSEYVLLFLRVYLGVGWFTSGLGKVMGGGFDASGFLQNAVQNPVVGPDGNPVYPWYTFLVENVFLSMTPAINVMIPWGELLVGLALIAGGFTAYAAFFGLLMNFSFLFAGTVSVNPLYILIGVVILAAGYKAGSLGLDRFIRPTMDKGAFRFPSHRRQERKTA